MHVELSFCACVALLSKLGKGERRRLSDVVRMRLFWNEVVERQWHITLARLAYAGDNRGIAVVMIGCVQSVAINALFFVPLDKSTLLCAVHFERA